MRDFRDAKAMAQTLRQSLNARSLSLSHGESLELVSKMLGVNDWNTLSSALKTPPSQSPAIAKSPETTSYPAIPVRDFVPFPAWEFPLFVGRDKTRQALDHAFQRHREIVVAVQIDPAVDEPDFANIYRIGVVATVLDIRLIPTHIFQGKTFNNMTKILLLAHRRVTIRNFTAENGAYRAEICHISEGKMPEAPELIAKAAALFRTYAALQTPNAKQAGALGLAGSNIGKTGDPGRVADIMTACVNLPLRDKQMLLETIDPVARLEKIVAVLEGLTKEPV